LAQCAGQTAWRTARPSAAPLCCTAGLQWALLRNALSYAVSYGVIRPIRAVPPVAVHEPGGAPESAGRRSDLVREFAAGLRFFRRSRFLVALVLLAVIGQFGTGALSTLNVFFATDNLRMPTHLYGYIGTAMGMGGIAGALCAGRVVPWVGARRTTWAGLLVSGLLRVVYSRQAGFVGGVVLLFLFTVPITMLNTAMAPLLLAAAPPWYRGRVVSVFYPVTQLASMLSAVLSGWLASSVLRDVTGSFAGVRF
ncbi:MFS transporter, partial [Burkholderia sp. Ax-1735]